MVTPKSYLTAEFTNHLDTKIDQLREEIVAIINANDVRYQERFEAQGKALDAAFGAAKEAVSVALVAQEKTAVKTELTADKRFSDLGELIREQFKGMTEKIESAVKRIGAIELVITGFTGEKSGGNTTKANAIQIWLLALATIGGLLGVITFFTK